jgi:RNA ligase (TIGR02306 family)
MSDHGVYVYRIEGFEPHPNPEVINLGIVKIGGYEVIVNKTQWTFPCLAAYVIPDSLVNTNLEQFGFLAKNAKADGWTRIRISKIQGIFSYGLLVPAPDGAKEGDDVQEILQVKHYEPPISFEDTGSRPAPKIRVNEVEVSVEFSKYDIEGIKNPKFNNAFAEGEEIVAHEKVHGSNTLITSVDGEIFVRSRSNWKKEDENNKWWTALNAHPEVKTFLLENPDLTVYGEIYGAVQNLKYGIPNKVDLILFDMQNSKTKKFLDYDEIVSYQEKYNLPWVPIVYKGPFDLNKIKELIEGDSLIPTAPKGHVMEGVVIRPMKEAEIRKSQRKILKLVSDRYFLKS